MANVDKPRGFEPVRTLSGAPVSGKMEQFPISSGYATIIGVGDAVQLSAAGNVERATTNATFLGVVMGIGNTSGITFGNAETFDPDRLGTASQISQASTAQVATVCLANDVVFAVQTDDSSTALVVGEDLDLPVAVALTAASLGSNQEIDTEASTNDDVKVVAIPTYNSASGGTNDASAANAEAHVIFNSITFGQT